MPAAAELEPRQATRLQTSGLIAWLAVEAATQQQADREARGDRSKLPTYVAAALMARCAKVLVNNCKGSMAAARATLGTGMVDMRTGAMHAVVA